MKLKTMWAAFVCCCLVAMGAAGSASASAVRDISIWGGETPGGLTDLSHLDWEESGGGDFEQRDECGVDMFFSCDFFTVEAPLVRIDASGTYPVGSKAGWTYTVPGGPDTYIESVVAGGVNITGESELTQEAGEPFISLGLWNGSSWTDRETNDEPAGQVELNVPDGAPGDRQVKFAAEAATGTGMTEDHWAGLSGMVVDLADDVPPVQTIDPLDVPSGWVDETPIDIPVEAEDDGLGVLKIVALGPKRNASGPFDWYLATESLNCVGNTDDPCPLATPSGSEITIEPAGMREGHTIITIGAMDAKENQAVEGVPGEFTHDMKIDTKDPAVSLGGSFTTAPGMVLDAPLYALESDAVDGNLTVANSGVVKIEVMVDDVVIDSDTQSCATENCDMGLDTDIEPDDYTNGNHVLKVKATDAVGHVKTETVEFEVDR